MASATAGGALPASVEDEDEVSTPSPFELAAVPVKVLLSANAAALAAAFS